METVTASKFKLGTNYQSPNTCVGCGGTDNGNLEGKGPGMVDVARDIRWYGTVYLCINCTREIAGVFGLLTADDYEDIADRLASRELQLTELQRENYVLRQIVDGYKALNLSGVVRGDHSIFGMESVRDLEKSSGESELEEEISDGDNLSEVGSEGINDEESGVDESDSSEGPSDILSTTSDDDSNSESKFLDE